MVQASLSFIHANPLGSRAIIDDVVVFLQTIRISNQLKACNQLLI
jgi:hypothetical protein